MRIVTGSAASVVTGMANGADVVVVERTLCRRLPVVTADGSSSSTGLRLGFPSRTGGTRRGLLGNSALVAGVSLVFNGRRNLFLLLDGLSPIDPGSG